MRTLTFEPYYHNKIEGAPPGVFPWDSLQTAFRPEEPGKIVYLAVAGRSRRPEDSGLPPDWSYIGRVCEAYYVRDDISDSPAVPCGFGVEFPYTERGLLGMINFFYGGRFGEFDKILIRPAYSVFNWDDLGRLRSGRLGLNLGDVDTTLRYYSHFWADRFDNLSPEQLVRLHQSVLKLQEVSK